MKRYLTLAAPLLVVAAGFGGFALLHHSRPEPDRKTETPRPISVYVEEARSSSTELIVTSAGEVRPRTRVDLVAQVAGRVASVSPEFIEGGIVTTDAPLLRIENTDYRLALTQAQLAMAEAELRLEQALADADVARKQLRGDAGASDLALKRPHVRQAEAGLAAAKARLQRAQLDLDRTVVALPFNGRIESIEVDIGEFVAPGARLGRAFSTHQVQVRLPLDDAQLASLGLPIGYVADADGELSVTFSKTVAGRMQFWSGRLVRVDAAVDPDTRVIYATALVDEPYGSNRSAHGMPLAVGLFVDAEINGRRVNDAVVIPRTALRTGGRVYVLGADGRLDIRDVTVAHTTREEAILATGVRDGEDVIVSAVRNAFDGMVLQGLRNTVDDSAVAHRELPANTRG